MSKYYEEHESMCQFELIWNTFNLRRSVRSSHRHHTNIWSLPPQSQHADSQQWISHPQEEQKGDPIFRR